VNFSMLQARVSCNVVHGAAQKVVVSSIRDSVSFICRPCSVPLQIRFDVPVSFVPSFQIHSGMIFPFTYRIVEHGVPGFDDEKSVIAAPIFWMAHVYKAGFFPE